MTDRELKDRLGSVCNPGMSDRGRHFVSEHEQRGLQLKEVIFIELRYLGPTGGFALLVLLTLMFTAVFSRDIYFMWVLSAALPVAGLIPLTAMGRSERHGMGEIEAACRFSLHFVRMTRIMILGSFSLAILFASSVIIGSRMQIGILTTLIYIAVPYLLNAWGCMLVLRKWHAAENIFGCIGIGLATALIPLIAERSEFIRTIPTALPGSACAVLLAVTVKESISYIKESENQAWSLC